MIGKIKTLNFKSLFFIGNVSLIFNSFIFNNYIFIGIFLLSFFISSKLSIVGLKKIKKFNIYQNIREEGPSFHLNKKNTPTMGGLFIVIPFLTLLFIMSIKLFSLKLLLLFFCVFGFFCIGFLDDYLSIKNQKNTGLKSQEKFILQSFITIIFILLALYKDYINPSIIISNNWENYQTIIVILFSFFTIVGLSNSVNLTDGLDGLASGCSAIVFYGLGTEILLKEQQELIIFSILCFAMSGLCFGFLQLNKFPAKLFMGDTGSLSIGAILGSISILTNSFITIFIFSGIFIAESLSVILQVSFFKITKKLYKRGQRLFLMAPLHHHFELMGYEEEKIVENFWKINILLVILGIVFKVTLQDLL